MIELSMMSSKDNKTEANLKEIQFKDFLNIADEYMKKYPSLSEFSLQCGDMSISFSYMSKAVYSPQMPHASSQNTVAEIATHSNYKEIKSNMVGTLYTAPSPTDQPYISVGSKVEEGQTLFIIEAMKVMSHFKSPHSGVVKEILVHNEEVVEYGKVLVRLE